MVRRAYKLLRIRKDGSLGPLFINKKLRIPFKEWLEAENHPTKGYTVRPGWHVAKQPCAPHLSLKDRVWAEVDIDDWYEFKRPVKQGSVWLIARIMRVLHLVVCDRCGDVHSVSRRPQMTAYTNDAANYAILCETCQQAEDEYWKERWRDYYSSIV